MRYYSIVIKDPKTGKVVRPASLASLNLPASYTSFVAGKSIAGALNVELDVPVYHFAIPTGGAWVRVWGVSLAEINQSADLNGLSLSLYAGMQKGLPLAKPAQSGLILQGTINQAWGNWVGTDMTLDLIVQADTGSADAPKNIVLNWKKNTPLADAVKSTLSTAFPGFSADVSIDPKLILAHDEVGYYQSMTQFAQYLEEMSASLIGGTYQGVKVLLTETTFRVYDGTTPKAPTVLAFEDLIGQPTWIDPLTVQFKTVMRADLSVGDYIKFPPAQTTSTAAGTPPLGSGLKQKSVFQGTFQIGFARHVGNFRQPNGDAWCSTFNAYSTEPGA